MSKLYKRIVTMGMISLTSILAWIYCIFIYRDEPVYVGIISVILVSSVYALLITIADMRADKETALQNYITTTINSGLDKLSSGNDNTEIERLIKALYVQVRKLNSSFTKLEETQNEALRQNQINNEIKDSTTDSINKAVKILIKYSQTDNAKLLTTVRELNDKLSSVTAQLENVTKELVEIKSGINSIDISSSTTNMELSQNNSSIQSTSKQSSISKDILEDTASDEALNTNVDEEAFLKAMAALEENSDETPDEAVNAVLTETAVEAPAEAVNVAPTETTAYEDTAQEMIGLRQEDLDALINGTSDSSADVIPFPSAKNETVSNTSNDSSDDEVIFDPNKTLSPDEIAALFASMGIDDETSDTSDSSVNISENTDNASVSAINTAENIQDIVAEPATPQISDDPNKQLSPDEIAALFASMGAGV